MKCKACDERLSEGEQAMDVRTGRLNDMCNECLSMGMMEHEFDYIKKAVDMVAINGTTKADNK